MGDWRRVHIVGTCAKEDVAALQRQITFDILRDTDFERSGPLSISGGIMGLPMWASERIDAVGNLWERDYEPEDVKDHLLQLASVAPSLSAKVHVGGAYEADACEAIVTLRNGNASVGVAEIDVIPEIDEGQMQRNLMWNLIRQSGPPSSLRGDE